MAGFRDFLVTAFIDMHLLRPEMHIGIHLGIKEPKGHIDSLYGLNAVLGLEETG